MPTQSFRYSDPRGPKYEFGDNDPATKPWWIAQAARNAWDKLTTPSNVTAPWAMNSRPVAQQERGAAAAGWAGQAQAGISPLINSGLALPGSNPSAPPLSWADNPDTVHGNTLAAPYQPGVGMPPNVTQPPQSAWGDPTSPESFRGPAQSAWYGPGSNAGNAPTPMNLGWGQEPYPTNNGVTAYNPAKGLGALTGTPQGSGAPAGPAAPAIPSAWAKFDPQWWNQFANTERQLSPDTRGMVTPDQYYNSPAQAAADLAWGEKFRATYGRAPTEDDWKFRWMHGGGSNPPVGNTAQQNAAMTPSGGPYNR